MVCSTPTRHFPDCVSNTASIRVRAGRSTKNPWPFPRTRSCCGRAARTLSVVPHRCKSSPALLFRESQAEMPGFFVFLLDSVWSVAQFKKIMEFFYIKTVVSWTLCLCLISILAFRARVAMSVTRAARCGDANKKSFFCVSMDAQHGAESVRCKPVSQDLPLGRQV